MNEERFCLDCGELLRGRLDKKFCDDLCRSNYNNRIYSENSSAVRRVNKILSRNRKIMETLNPAGKVKVSRKKMLEKGFDFSFITSFYQTQTGKTYYFCYEYGYLSLENEDVLLVKREEGQC